MFGNYIKIAVRVIMRHKGFSLINILGLSVGMACVFLIALWLRFELSFDRFHEHAESIFRIYSKFPTEQGVDRFIGTPAPLAAALKNEFPEVLHVVRFGGRNPSLVRYNNRQFREPNIWYADSSIFRVFTFPLLSGDPSTALIEPNSVVISQATAAKYFNKENPIGKPLQIYSDRNPVDFIVTGVLQNIPSNSQLQFDMLIPFHRLSSNLGWHQYNYLTYIRLSDLADPDALDVKISGLLPKVTDGNVELHLQSLRSIHLFSNIRGELPTNTDFNYVLIFSGAALLILFIACFNFVNLSTALSITRIREIGMRKVVGARKKQLVLQMLAESLILSVIAFLVAVALAEMLLPQFNSLSGRNLSFDYLNHPELAAILLGLALATGILAGVYPAFFMSSFPSISMIKNSLSFTGRTSSLNIQKGLFLLQFVITVLFLISASTIFRQLHFMRTKNLGYDKDFLVILPIDKDEIHNRAAIYKSEIVKYTDINSATATTFMTATHGYYQNAWYEGIPRTSDPKLQWSQGQSIMLHWMGADYDFIKTLGLKVIQGRDFSPEISTDAEFAYIVNKTFVQHIQKTREDWENPIGKEFQISCKPKPGRIIGIIDDFHFESLKDNLEPVAICIYPNVHENLVVRINPHNIQGAMEILEKEWKKMFPSDPFEYSFFNQDFERVYRSEIKLGRLFGCITMLALFTTCLGLFGLVSFNAQRRTKEIGIRKTLGASIPRVMFLLAVDFSKWVIIANIIAAPIALYVMNKWLENFAYRVEPGLLLILFALLVTITISLLTVAYQVIKAARANPVEALRYE